MESERDSIKYCSSQGRRVPVEITAKRNKENKILRYLLTSAKNDNFAGISIEREASASGGPLDAHADLTIDARDEEPVNGCYHMIRIVSD